MICSNCATENAPGRKFCANCGTRLAVVCTNCGAANTPGDRFCGECGTALAEDVAAAAPASAGAGGGPLEVGPASITAQPSAPTAERRVVSVLFADLVGFTTYSEARDAEEVRDVLSRYFDTARDVIARYGGTVEKFIGDAVMAVWGAPVAREDDAERAVRAALELVDAVERRDEPLTITRNGKAVAIIVSAEEYDSWHETLEILRDPQFVQEIREGVRSLARTRKRQTVTDLFRG